MGRPTKPKQNATECPHTDRIAHAKGMCESCYNQSKRTSESIAKNNASDAAKAAKQHYEDANRERRNAQRREYARQRYAKKKIESVEPENQE
jgi:hypothetical protein